MKDETKETACILGCGIIFGTALGWLLSPAKAEAYDPRVLSRNIHLTINLTVPKEDALGVIERLLPEEE